MSPIPRAVRDAVAGKPHPVQRLAARDLALAYGERCVIDGVDVTIPDGSFTVIVGPNACGKSTLLRALSRLLRPRHGTVVLDGRDIQDRSAKQVARTLGLLPQSSSAPEGITVAELVARGRFPHHGLVQRWTRADEEALIAALDATRTTELSARQVDELSGGQRQRVWVAMVLAQQTPLLLLDEPTTFLDMAHQVDLMELFAELHHGGHTVVAVLHDLNQACRYATHLIAMKDGAIVAQGEPDRIVGPDLIREVFGLDTVVIDDPVSGGPLVVPVGRSGLAERQRMA